MTDELHAHMDAAGIPGTGDPLENALRVLWTAGVDIESAIVEAITTPDVRRHLIERALDEVRHVPKHVSRGPGRIISFPVGTPGRRPVAAIGVRRGGAPSFEGAPTLEGRGISFFPGHARDVAQPGQKRAEPEAR